MILFFILGSRNEKARAVAGFQSGFSRHKQKNRRLAGLLWAYLSHELNITHRNGLRKHLAEYFFVLVSAHHSARAPTANAGGGSACPKTPRFRGCFPYKFRT